MGRIKKDSNQCPLCLRTAPKTCDRQVCAFWRLGYDTKTFDEVYPDEQSNPDLTPPQARIA